MSSKPDVADCLFVHPGVPLAVGPYLARSFGSDRTVFLRLLALRGLGFFARRIHRRKMSIVSKTQTDTTSPRRIVRLSKSFGECILASISLLLMRLPATIARDVGHVID